MARGGRVIWGSLRASDQVEEIKEEIPKPKDGQCHECGHGSFTLKIRDHDLIRTCKSCFTQYNIDKGVIGKWD
jgi:hypothetical protein